MAFDGRPYVLGKICVDRGSRVLGEKSNALRDGAAHWFSWTNNRHWPLAVFDDNFGTRAYVLQQVRHVGRSSFLFRDVDDMFSHIVILHHGARS